MIDAAVIKKMTRNSFLISVVFHLLLLLFFINISAIFNFKPVENTKKPPQLYIPSYVYHGAITPAMPHPVTQASSNTRSITESQPETKPIEKPQEKPAALAASMQPNSTAVKKRDPFQQKSIMDMSRSIIQHNQTSAAVNQLNSEEPPILMVGDKHAVVDPLAKLMGRSLSAHFHYPNIEGIFGARGRVYIALVLHPEGYFSNVQIVQPSDIQDFNVAALYAVNTAPTVVGVGKFLSKPTRFVVGFIFE